MCQSLISFPCFIIDESERRCRWKPANPHCSKSKLCKRLKLRGLARVSDPDPVFEYTGAGSGVSPQNKKKECKKGSKIIRI